MSLLYIYELIKRLNLCRAKVYDPNELHDKVSLPYLDP